MTSVCWSLLAAFCAVLMECLYRVLPGGWWPWIWIWAPLSLTISYSICKLITVPGVPLVGALIIWTLSVMGLRVLLTTVILRDAVPVGTWAALGLMVVARVVQVSWK